MIAMVVVTMQGLQVVYLQEQIKLEQQIGKRNALASLLSN